MPGREGKEKIDRLRRPGGVEFQCDATRMDGVETMDLLLSAILIVAVPCMVARLLTLPLFFLPGILRDALTFVLAVVGIFGLIIKQIIG